MRIAVVVLVVGVAVAAVAASVPVVDRTRTQRVIDNSLLFAPSGPELRMAASGQEEPLSDLLWVRGLITFGERWEAAPSPEWVEWLTTVLSAVNTLDPRWRTPYFYGGLMMRVVDDVDGSDKIFLAGHEAMPDDWFFPFSIGMNAYLYRDDLEQASGWMEKAAHLPDAPVFLASLAAEFKKRNGKQGEAIAYLKRVVASDPPPAVRADAERQLARFEHNELVETWAAACRAFRERTGRPLADVSELERELGRPLPDNPRGDGWIVGNDGVVRSPAAERERRYRLVGAEMGLLR